MTIETLILRCVIILIAVGSVTLPVVTLVDAHRERIGKEPLFKGKVRNIIIVNKRVTEREFF